MTGITQGTISAYEGGKIECSAERLFMLADALDVQPRWLLHGVHEREKSPTPSILGRVMSRYEHLAELLPKDLDALRNGYSARQGRRVRSWEDWAWAADILRDSKPSAVHAKKLGKK